MAKILVVDYERNLRTLYQRELAEDGHRITTAGSAGEALARFFEDEPDLVVLDVPRPYGEELEELGGLLSFERHVPVVFNSSHSHYSDNFLSLPADACVEKSADLLALRQTIRQVLNARTSTTRR